MFGKGSLKVFAGNANPKLAEEIATCLGIGLGESEVSTFNNGEIKVRINESVRGEDVFVIQSTSTPVNDNLMELLVMIDALKRASASRITAVIPCFGYARQDRKSKPREPITAKLVADLLTVAGAERVLTMDLHADQIQGFFNIPVDHLTAVPTLADYLLTKKLEDLTIVSPDMGGAGRARAMAERLQSPIAIVDKRRPEPGEAQVMNIVGDVAGRNIVIVDDMIDTAGSLVEGIKYIKKRGAKDIYACCTHPIFSGPACSRLTECSALEIITTNTIELPPEKKLKKVRVLSVAPLLADAINRIHNGLSVSALFN